MEALVLVFLISLCSDLLSCEWQSARERGQFAKIAALSAVIEAMSWFPIFVAVFTRDIWLVVAGVLGAVAGGVWGAARERRRQAEDFPHARVYGTAYLCDDWPDHIVVVPIGKTNYLHLCRSEDDPVPIGKNAFANREIRSPTGSDRPDRECRRSPPGRCTRGHHEDDHCAAVEEWEPEPLF